MRILIVGNLYPPVVFGGYELLCRQAVEGLRGAGHEVRVLTSSFGREDCPPDATVERSLSLTTPFPRPGEKVGFVDFRPGSIERVARVNRRLTEAAIASVRPDRLFCWCLNRLSLGPIFAAQGAGVPACYTINDEHPRQFRFESRVTGLKSLARRIAEATVWRTATLRNLRPFSVTIISEALKRSLIRQGVPIEHARVIHQGIRLEDFPYLPLRREAEEPLRLLYVGQLSRVKGVHTILKAVGRLGREGLTSLRLEVVGAGVPDYEKELRELAESQGIADRVFFRGAVPHGEIALRHRANHVLVFSSEWEEPFGLAHLEAMASGCAVISTTTGGSAELVRDGENALAFRAGDDADLAGKIRGLAGNEEERRRLAKGGRTGVEERHSFAVYLRAIESFLRDAA